MDDSFELHFIQAWRRVTQSSHLQQSGERMTALGGAGSFITKPSLSDCQNIPLSEPFFVGRYSPSLHGSSKAFYDLEDPKPWSFILKRPSTMSNPQAVLSSLPLIAGSGLPKLPAFCLCHPDLQTWQPVVTVAFSWLGMSSSILPMSVSSISGPGIKPPPLPPLPRATSKTI